MTANTEDQKKKIYTENKNEHFYWGAVHFIVVTVTMYHIILCWATSWKHLEVNFGNNLT